MFFWLDAYQERCTCPREGGASIEEGSGSQNLQLPVANVHNLLLEWNLPCIQFDDLRQGRIIEYVEAISCIQFDDPRQGRIIEYVVAISCIQFDDLRQVGQEKKVERGSDARILYKQVQVQVNASTCLNSVQDLIDQLDSGVLLDHLPHLYISRDKCKIKNYS